MHSTFRLGPRIFYTVARTMHQMSSLLTLECRPILVPEYDQTVDCFVLESSAKHLEGDEKLMSLAGSLGYVAPGKSSSACRKS